METLEKQPQMFGEIDDLAMSIQDDAGLRSPAKLAIDHMLDGDTIFTGAPVAEAAVEPMGLE